MPTQPQYFLEEFAEQMLAQLGLDNLSQVEREQFLPSIVHNLEMRLGDALLPLVSDSAAPAFRALVSSDSTSEQWLDFWHKTVPNFDDVVKRVLVDFAEESKAILNP